MKVLVSFFLLIISVACFGQDTNEKVKIVTKDGTVLTGTLSLSDSDSVTIKTAYGENKIDRSEIVSLDYTDRKGDNASEEDLDRYSASHYLFGQSAHGLKKGQLYYENTYLFLNSFTYGVSDNFSIGGGFEVASPLFGGEFPITFIAPKLSIPFEGGAFAITSTLFVLPYDGGFAAGLLSGAVTIGSLRSNFTLGVGAGYTFDDGIEDGFVPFSVSGIQRVSEKLSLITENVFVTGSGFTEGIISGGVRIHGRNGNFLTISLFRPTEDTGPLVALPFFSGTVILK